MNDKLFYLKQIKDDLDEETFKFVAAEVTVKYYINSFIDRGLKINRAKVMDRANLALKSLGVDEISYGYVRKFV